ncbi:hypothetical protein ACFX1R_006041 [Malus domestica]
MVPSSVHRLIFLIKPVALLEFLTLSMKLGIRRIRISLFGLTLLFLKNILFTVGVTSSRDIRLNLENRFGDVSAAHIHQLRSRLHYLHKGDLSISEYLQRIKGISDVLMAAGYPVSDHDLIDVILNGLFDEYEFFIDSIMLRISSTTLDELHGLLINKELFMNRKKKSVVSSSQEPLQAFAAQSHDYCAKIIICHNCSEIWEECEIEQHKLVERNSIVV